MPLKWRSCELRGDGSFEGGLGSHAFCLVYFGDGQWVWTMNGMPHNARVPLLGFADTADEAKQAANEIFDVWLERSGLRIARTCPSGLTQLDDQLTDHASAS
ncbi:hypothetical protein [Microvirga calopogonii]|uniref:hypothetical protein n=1 Tax=Microvirga calopogonii TaxID=2078013 RepID=UPI000E0CD386|nr:hypothetical protein [Microvirga calopogonii]